MRPLFDPFFATGFAGVAGLAALDAAAAAAAPMPPRTRPPQRVVEKQAGTKESFATNK